VTDGEPMEDVPIRVPAKHTRDLGMNEPDQIEGLRSRIWCRVMMYRPTLLYLVTVPYGDCDRL
jgi:hypothetical protein